MELKSFTIEDVRNLKGEQRHSSIEMYQEWLKKVRLQDKQVLNKHKIRKDNFIHREQIKKWQLEHYQEKKKYSAKYRALNKKKIAMLLKDYYVRNKETLLRYQKQYRESKKKGDLE